ncbi:DnaJ-like subfamily C member 21 [Pseudocercospora fuligena]|uniref:DnaJ-like subfamily C member 21 n=1 Tax=Pseudocercospora fuligena TaxID=685502 RepID=A0A8H6RTR1_9PEZI|nr:DnaJ-like subfamily C member 21 [Pseudocercospora fuligena]
MGQSQSTSDGGAGAAVDVKTSYYVLLGVERSATEEEIKKAYRRKALELHPDRNYGNEEEATKTFAEVQSAYEVLSDPQERAWYDSHESAILRGGEPGDGNAPVYEDVKVTSADDLARIIGKFNKNVEFTDSPSGFFGFLRETFEHLAKEEEVAAQWEDAEFLEYPTFGHKDDEYQDVVRSFYAVWSGFSTVKSFSWCDRYRVSEAPDRFIRRRMEQENAKLRKDAKAEFNEAVRSLVQFVKKRDPRFVPNTQTEEERQKALRDAAAAQRKRAQEANAAKMNEDVPEWTKSRDPAEDELEGTFSESEVEEEVFECVACNKIFKSEKQMEAHEKSKKHQKAVKELQKRLRKQNAHLNLDEEPISSGVVTPEVDADEEEELLDDIAAQIEEQEARENGAAEHSGGDENDVELFEAAESAADEKEQEDSEPPRQHDTTPSNSESEDDEYASREAIEARLASTSLNAPTKTDQPPVFDTPATPNSEDDLSASQPAQKKLGKAAQKRAKKAAAAAEAEATNDPETAAHRCQGCDASFGSKTKLFDHLKSNPKHATLKSVSTGKGKKKGKK